MALSNLTKVQTLGIGSNIEVVGVITTGQFKSGTSNLHSTGVELTNLNVSGIATIGGSISIGGTLTYQDVTNIDSVGIITARSNIDCNGDLDVDGHTNLDNVSVAGISTFSKNIILPDSTDTTDGRIKFGATQDMMLFHYGGANYIDVTTNLNIRGSSSGNTISIKPKSAEEGIKIIPDGAVQLFHNNVNKFETTGAGVTVTNGHLQQQYGGIASKVGYVSGGAEAYFGSTSNHSLVLGTNNTERLRITTSGSIGLNGANYGSAGQVFTSQGSGSAPTWSTVSGTTINSNADNRVITGSGTANTLNAESTFVHDPVNCDTQIIHNSNNVADLLVQNNSGGTGANARLTLQSGSNSNAGPQLGMVCGSHTWYLQVPKAAGNLEFTNNGTLDFLMADDGDFHIVDGDLVLASGHGIDFSADGNASGMGSELLDDYEEGSFTATLSSTGGNASFASGHIQTACLYIKIGSMVHIQGYFSGTNVTNGGSGIVKVSGLPFASNNTTYYTIGITHNTMTAQDCTGAYIQYANTYFFPIQTNTTSGSAFNVGNPRYLMFGGSYPVQY